MMVIYLDIDRNIINLVDREFPTFKTTVTDKVQGVQTNLDKHIQAGYTEPIEYIDETLPINQPAATYTDPFISEWIFSPSDAKPKPAIFPEPEPIITEPEPECIAIIDGRCCLDLIFEDKCRLYAD